VFKKVEITDAFEDDYCVAMLAFNETGLARLVLFFLIR
jgi:hypothetical protein